MQVVWVVECHEVNGIVTHIFSSEAKAMSYCDTDDRLHTIWDCILDDTQMFEATSPTVQ